MMEGLASTDPSPSKTVPTSPVTTQDSDLHAPTTDASENLTPSNTVPPAPVTTQDSDLHATPSPAANRDLWSASRDGDLERVKRILSAGHVDINTRRGWWSTTPVMMAAYNGHTDVMEFLVGRGADVSLVSNNGYNVLHLACMGGDLDTVKLILSLNVVDINSGGGLDNKTPVMAAVEEGHGDVVEFLVGRGADVSLVDSVGRNILHWACMGGDLEILKLILSLNVVDINSRGGRDSKTPVMEAARYGNRDVVEFLVGRGADVSLVDSNGGNALHWACSDGHLETVKLILSLNVVDINTRGGYHSWTPVMEAARVGHRDVVEFLVGRGADVSLVDRNGHNVLHLASMGENLETVKLILSLNVVDINARDNIGRTAAYLAVDPRVLNFLVSRGGHCGQRRSKCRY